MQNLQHTNPETRDRFRSDALALLKDADQIIEGADRSGRLLTHNENVRLRAVVERARHLNARAEGKPDGDDIHSLSQRSLIFRAIHALVKGGGNRTAALKIVQGVDPEVGLIIKAATAAADSTTATWAAELLAPALGEFIPLLRPKSALFTLAPDPVPLIGTVRFPRGTANNATGFVEEGAPIPVKEGGTEAFNLTPRKAAGICVATGELIRRADAFAESYVMGTLSDDISLGVDQVFMSDSAADAAAPAGIFHADNATVAAAATAGGTAAALAADLAALITAGANMVRPVLLINPVALAGAAGLSGSGDYAIIQALSAGRIGDRMQVITSGNLTAATIVLIDAANLIVAGSGFTLDVSEHTSLHMSDTPSADLGGAGNPTPVRSMYQTDSVAILVKLFVTWHSKRTTDVQFIANVTWA